MRMRTDDEYLFRHLRVSDATFDVGVVLPASGTAEVVTEIYGAPRYHSPAYDPATLVWASTTALYCPGGPWDSVGPGGPSASIEYSYTCSDDLAPLDEMGCRGTFSNEDCGSVEQSSRRVANVVQTVHIDESYLESHPDWPDSPNEYFHRPEWMWVADTYFRLWAVCDIAPHRYWPKGSDDEWWEFGNDTGYQQVPSDWRCEFTMVDGESVTSTVSYGPHYQPGLSGIHERRGRVLAVNAIDIDCPAVDADVQTERRYYGYDSSLSDTPQEGF